MFRNFVLAAVTLAAMGCSQPGQECTSQRDCFGGESCIDGNCRLIVESTNNRQDGVEQITPDASTDQGHSDASSAPDAGLDAASGEDAGCVPQCAGAQCGEDPVCGESCGECQAEQVCESGQCAAARVYTEWQLDGQVVHQSTSSEGYLQQDNIFVGLPHNGRTIQLNLSDVSTTSSVSYSCADEPMTFSPLSLITSDNGWADLDALPQRWKGLILNGSHCLNPADDTLSTWSLEVTSLSVDRVIGTVSIAIDGGGPRAGEQLTIESRFDVDVVAQ